MWRVCFIWKPNPHMPSIELIYIYIISVHTSPLAIIFVQRFSSHHWSKLVKLPGWWFQPLWKILVSWGYYSQYMEKYKKKMFQTSNQKKVKLHFAMPFPVLYQALNSQLCPILSHWPRLSEELDIVLRCSPEWHRQNQISELRVVVPRG